MMGLESPKLLASTLKVAKTKPFFGFNTSERTIMVFCLAGCENWVI
jgi:hypothetical protein